MKNIEKFTGNVKKLIPKSTAKEVEVYELIKPEKQGAPFAFNLLKLKPGGVVQVQSHEDQHAVFIHSGKCKILLGDEWVDVEKEGFVFIPPNLVHSFENPYSDPAEVIIMKLLMPFEH